ncbi:hypothetical protein OBBRIDRAFT_793560 [Obba rivulosa]|uniref:Uncharacterized protein n=1 Tax=Obba rivulosa TaxID=1052685 RepID=A0A8E2B0W3_9APHY|nr:hypothetical protein OBBRIDRAFT_793560 [Obba rivulosa]
MSKGEPDSGHAVASDDTARQLLDIIKRKDGTNTGFKCNTQSSLPPITSQHALDIAASLQPLVQRYVLLLP